MDNLSKFSEQLDSLMFERELTPFQLAQIIGVDATCIARYLHGERKPSVENLVKLADYFQCTTDFLLGREDENYCTTFYPCPPFAEQLLILKQHFNCPWWHFYKKAHVASSRLFDWKNGSHIPTIDSAINLANGFDCTVDFIIGRTRS